MKILLIKRDKIGDLLLTTPLFAHLRAQLPKAEIHLLANDYNAWIADGHAALDRVWIYPRVKVNDAVRWRAAFRQIALMLELRRIGFDFVVVAQGEMSARAVKRGYSVGARRTVAFIEPKHWLFSRLSDAIRPPTSGHETERMFRLLRPLGIEAPAVPTYPSFNLPTRCDDFARGWLRERELVPGRYVVLGIGARQLRRQPLLQQIERWARSIYDTHGLASVFVWTPGSSRSALYPGDDDLVAAFIAQTPAYILPYRGPVLETLGLVWQACTSLFPDSGLMHLAAASPGGVLGLFADPPDHFERWLPRGRNVLAVNADTAIPLLSDNVVLSALERLIDASTRNQRVACEQPDVRSRLPQPDLARRDD